MNNEKGMDRKKDFHCEFIFTHKKKENNINFICFRTLTKNDVKRKEKKEITEDLIKDMRILQKLLSMDIVHNELYFFCF